MKHLFISLLVTTYATAGLAQTTDNVGIGTTTPNPSAMLDVTDGYDPLGNPPRPPKGLLVPRVNQLKRDLMFAEFQGNIADGLLVYEEDFKQFWYYRYDLPTPANPPFGQWIPLATVAPSQSNVPQGGIIMWSGTIASIPAGWALCDGSNGTPDLTDKFIISVASAGENPGTASVPNQYVNVEAGAAIAPDRRFFKLAYILKL